MTVICMSYTAHVHVFVCARVHHFACAAGRGLSLTSACDQPLPHNSDTDAQDAMNSKTAIRTSNLMWANHCDSHCYSCDTHEGPCTLYGSVDQGGVLA